jgi:hypothetical protein
MTRESGTKAKGSGTEVRHDVLLLGGAEQRPTHPCLLGRALSVALRRGKTVGLWGGPSIALRGWKTLAGQGATSTSACAAGTASDLWSRRARSVAPARRGLRRLAWQRIGRQALYRPAQRAVLSASASSPVQPRPLQPPSPSPSLEHWQFTTQRGGHFFVLSLLIGNDLVAVLGVVEISEVLHQARRNTAWTREGALRDSP